MSKESGTEPKTVTYCPNVTMVSGHGAHCTLAEAQLEAMRHRVDELRAALVWVTEYPESTRAVAWARLTLMKYQPKLVAGSPLKR